MAKRLIALLVLFLAFACGCDSDSFDLQTEYAAHVTCDEAETRLQFLSLTDNDTDMPRVDVIGDENLGYGVLKFVVNQGSVPDWENDVPAFCKDRADLGEDAAGPCVFQPLFNALAQIADMYGIGYDEIAVDIAYNTKGSSTYPQEMIDSLDQTLNAYINGLGFDAETEPALEHQHNAYTHKASSGASNPDWMSRLDSNLTLSRISMPGTHDTMSHYGGDIVQTQSLRLSAQLSSGIRALDIRCRHFNNKFPIHHGSVYQHANFNDVLTTAQQFLGSHPGETIVMRVTDEYKAEGNTRSFAATFNAYASNYPGLIWKYDGNNNPSLWDIRGKIVILQDFPADSANPQVGIPWKSAKIQDAYNLKSNWDLYDKWIKVKNQLNAAMNGDKNDIYINFLSGSGGSFPYFVASGKSSPEDNAPLLLTGLTTPGWKKKYPDFPRVSCALGICSIAFLGTNILTSERLTSKRVGIIMADFPGKGLINDVIKCN